MKSTTRDAVLAALSARDGFVSGHSIADELGISRNAVWKHVEALKASGYAIESVKARGYRLLGSPDRLDEAAICEHLVTEALGRHLVCKSSTGSTNSDLAALARDGAPEGTVVVADAQSAGRGRLGRSWVSAPGLNLYMSVLLRPEIVPAAAPQLSLVAGLAVAAALDECGLAPRIKWPNDVLLDRRKVCGILTEIDGEADRVRHVVVGIGVNLNSTLEHFPEELHDKATSVYLTGGRAVDRAEFAARLLSELEDRYRTFHAYGFGALAPEWNARAAMVGAHVSVSGAGEPISGRCKGIDADGALLLEAQDDATIVRRVLAGDVTVVGGYS